MGTFFLGLGKMGIYHEHKLVFYHIPKTAGRAIDSWLGEANEQPGHVTAWEMQEFLKRDVYMPLSWFNGRTLDPGNICLTTWASMTKQERVQANYKTYTTFSIVRDPVDRIRSAWHHRNREARRTLWEWKDLFKGSFNDAILHYGFEDLVKDKDRESEHFNPIPWLFVNEAGEEILPDIVLDFEFLERDSARLVDLLGLGLEPFYPKRNRYIKEDLCPKAFEKFRSIYQSEYDMLAKLRGKLISREEA